MRWRAFQLVHATTFGYVVDMEMHVRIAVPAAQPALAGGRVSVFPAQI